MFAKKIKRSFSFLRKNLLRRKIKEKILKGEDIKIVIGAGHTDYEGWLKTDIDILDITKEKDWSYLFNPSSISNIVAEHVWEHLIPEDSQKALSLCNKYLKKSGRIRIAVPDGNSPDKDYIEMVKPGGSGNGSKDHKILYTYKILKKNFEEAGFKVFPVEYFDANKIFRKNEWSKEDGFIRRSRDNDERNKGGLKYTSLIVDGIKM